jgi:hypothetical protein
MTRSPFSLVLAFLACCAILLPALAHAQSEQRGGRVEWARLKTDYVYWNRHSQAEPMIVDFIRENTSFDIDPQWRAADIENLNELCAYPFLFSEGIHRVRSLTALHNLGEYLKRGGFLFVDACIHPEVNPDPDAFLSEQVMKLRELVPDAVVTAVPANDPIYTCYFNMSSGLPHSYFYSIYDEKWARHGLYRVTSKDRVVAMISLSGLKCGWARLQTMPNHDILCMRMMLNIYLFTLTQ